MKTPVPKLLLVEDDRFLRRAAELALVRAGYSVLTAVDGVIGLQLARDERPDLVLLDLLMPRMSGLEVLAALRADDATRDLPVLVLSNSSIDHVVSQVRALGADYLVKANLSLHELVARVAALLDRVPSPDGAPGPVASGVSAR